MSEGGVLVLLITSLRPTLIPIYDCRLLYRLGLSQDS
jgi:hypothetical protein